MSVVFKKEASSKMDVPCRGKKALYQIVITIDFPTDDPAEDLKFMIQDMVEVLQDAKMYGRDENYTQVLKLLENMMPDQQTYKELVDNL